MAWGEPHGGAPLHGRPLLEYLGPLLEPARSLRYENPSTFVDVTDDELERAERALKAISYSCQQGARLLARVREARNRVALPAAESKVVDLMAALEESILEARAARGSAEETE